MKPSYRTLVKPKTCGPNPVHSPTNNLVTIHIGRRARIFQTPWWPDSQMKENENQIEIQLRAGLYSLAGLNWPAGCQLMITGLQHRVYPFFTEWFIRRDQIPCVYNMQNNSNFNEA